MEFQFPMIAKRIVPIVVACGIAVAILLWFHHELSKLNSALRLTQSLLHTSNHELSIIKSGRLSQLKLSNLTNSSGETPLVNLSNHNNCLCEPNLASGKNLSDLNGNSESLKLSSGENRVNLIPRSGMSPSEWKSFVAMQLHATSNFSAAMYARWSRYLQKEWINDDYKTSTPKAMEWDNCMNGIEYCVISMGLYAHEAKYLELIKTRLPRYRDAMDTFYPGWRLRIYHDESVPLSVLESVAARGAETILVTDFKGFIAGMFWRFFVADDPNVDRYIVRDLDSDFIWRERAAIDEWIRSNFSFHSMADADNHDVPIMGGMWGGTSKQKLPFSIKEKALQNLHQTEYKGGDQNFLAEVVWPEWQKTGLVFVSLTVVVYAF